MLCSDPLDYPSDGWLTELTILAKPSSLALLLDYPKTRSLPQSGIDFEGADIQGADFTNAILRGANFRSVIGGLKWNPMLRKTSFRNADLTDADCTLGQFERTDFNGAIFNRECWLQAQKVGRVRHPSFRQSKPRHRRLSGKGAVLAVCWILVFLLLGANLLLVFYFGFLYMEYTRRQGNIFLSAFLFWELWGYIASGKPGE
jgi:hypothetical protein